MIPDPFLIGHAERRLRRHGFNADGKILVVWHPGLKSTAGTANHRKMRICLHPGLRGHPGETVRTFKHELAHILARLRANGKPIKSHGREWKQACCDLGIPGEKVTHALPLRRHRRK